MEDKCPNSKMLELGICLNTVNKRMIFMRIDSCRNCGSEIKVIELCSECSQPLHFQCQNCRKFQDEPIHSHGNNIF